MEVTLHFSEDGLWCLEGKYELGETDVVTGKFKTKVGMEKVSQWRHPIIPLGILKLWCFRIRTKQFSSANCAEVREYLTELDSLFSR